VVFALLNVGRGQSFATIPSGQSGHGPTHSGTELAVSGAGNAGEARPLRGGFLEKPVSKKRSARVLIIDDHPLVADAIAECIRTIDPEAVITQATGFEEGVELAAAGSVDLVLLDYRMPGIQGLQGLRLMRGRFPELRITMISGIADGPQILEAIQLGAAGFIPKDLSVPALMKALELVLLGESFVPAKALRGPGMGESAAQFDIAAAVPTRGRLHVLTKRELEVLELVVLGKPNKEIAKIIGTKDTTVAFHLKNVFRKLGVKNRTEAAAAARKLGLGAREF